VQRPDDHKGKAVSRNHRPAEVMNQSGQKELEVAGVKAGAKSRSNDAHFLETIRQSSCPITSTVVPSSLPKQQPRRHKMSGNGYSNLPGFLELFIESFRKTKSPTNLTYFL
jgi:hypothetical protein